MGKYKWGKILLLKFYPVNVSTNFKSFVTDLWPFMAIVRFKNEKKIETFLERQSTRRLAKQTKAEVASVYSITYHYDLIFIMLAM